MTKEQLSKAINALKNITIDFKIDYFMNQGDCTVRGIFIKNSNDITKVRSILDSDVLKSFKFKNSKTWYLGDERDVILMQLKNKIKISIEELESFHVNNYS
jgi:hypothetical protein